MNAKLLFHRRAYCVTQTLALFNAMFIYSANDATSKYYYTSVMSFLLNRRYFNTTRISFFPIEHRRTESVCYFEIFTYKQNPNQDILC
jgi:hypothetical protein